ncbi:MAG: YitT family protein [Tissierellales bacterium]|nr:YitT family protein [Tissierellales bacterium]
MYDTKKKIIRFIWITIGALIMAIAINLFIVPHHLVSGGVTGLSLILQYLTGIKAGVLILIINIPLFLIGMREINREFILTSLYGMLSLSIFLVLTEKYSSYVIVEDLLASCIYGGLFSGLGAGIIFRQSASTGGTDIVAVIMKKRYDISISSIGFVLNAFIVLMGAFTVNYTIAMYTLINMFIFAKVFDVLLQGFDRRKMILIITDESENMAQAIMKGLKRGVTYLEGEGAYTKNKKKIVYCIVSQRQMADLKRIINQIDPKAFMSIIDTSEIHGLGFKNIEF